MKYIITTEQENRYEEVLFIVDADSEDEIRKEWLALSKPYNDAKDKVQKLWAENENHEQESLEASLLSIQKVLYKGKEFSMSEFCESTIRDYRISTLEDWLFEQREYFKRITLPQE